MRNYLLLFCVTIFIIINLPGCTGNESAADCYEYGDVEQKTTCATFDIGIDSPSTKGNLVSDAGESGAITSVRLLVYRHTASNNGICEIDTTVASGNTSVPAALASGWKRVLALANEDGKPWRFPNQKGQTLDKLIATKTGASAYKLYLNEVDFGSPALTATPAPLAALNYSSIAGASNFVFSNSLADSSSLRELAPAIGSGDSYNGGVPDPNKNHFNIYVKRTVAKVTAYTTAASASPVPVLDGKGTLSNLFWGVRNLNRAVALFQVPAPNGKPQAPFFNELETKTTGEMDKLATYQSFWWTGDATGAGINIPLPLGAPSYTYYYIPENANNRPSVGNATYLVTKATFTPAAHTVVTGFTNSNAGKQVTGATKGDLPTGTTFYRLAGVSGTTGASNINTYGSTWIREGDFFQNREDAERMAYIAEHDGSDTGYASTYTPATIRIEAYLDGICYYRMDITNADGTAYVERNKQYRGSINSFATIGLATLSSIEEPETKAIDGPASVNSSIRVLPWEVVDFGGAQ